jgi:hypothetical protein
MEDKIRNYQERIILLRKKLAEIEARRAGYDQGMPPEIWQELVHVSRELDHAERKLVEINQELATDVNCTRDEIISTLGRYTRWREQMREIEKLFLVNIVRPGQHLRQAIRQRAHLESEYERLYTSIQRAGFASQQDLEAEIRHVLKGSHTADDVMEQGEDEEWLQQEDPASWMVDVTVDDLEEAVSMEELVKEFKRVVLPRIHPDTSDTSPEVFNTVYEVFKNFDPILMEAYVIEYRREIQPEPDADPLEELDRLTFAQKRYQRSSARLQRRVDRIKQDLTPQEIENPQKIQENMRVQRQEILARIQAEAEQIIYWREKIENLVAVYREYYSHSGGGK